MIKITTGIMTDENDIEYYDCEIKDGNTFDTLNDIKQSDYDFYNMNKNTISSIVKLCHNTGVTSFTIVNTAKKDQLKSVFDDITKKMKTCPNKIFFILYTKTLSDGYEIGRFVTEHRLFNLLDESDSDTCIGCSSMSDIIKIFK